MLINSDSPNFSKPASGFLVLEGVNGAGKTTLQLKILDYLKQSGRQTVSTREPGATLIGKTIRSLLLDKKEECLSNLAELFLFAADRAEHVAKVIAPAIESRSLVVSDRYYYSTIAFQGYGRGLDLSLLKQINDTAIAGVYPDFVVLLDLSAEEGLRRAEGRQKAGGTEDYDTFEQEAKDFHNRIRNGFLTIAEEYPEPFLVVDASKSPDEIFAKVKPVLDKWLERLM